MQLPLNVAVLLCVCVCFQWFGVGGEWVWWTWAVGRWIVCVIRSNMYLMYCCYEDNALHLHRTHVCVCYWNSFCYLCRTCCSQSPSPQSTWLANGLDKLLRSLSWHSVWWWSRNLNVDHNGIVIGRLLRTCCKLILPVTLFLIRMWTPAISYFQLCLRQA